MQNLLVITVSALVYIRRYEMSTRLLLDELRLEKFRSFEDVNIPIGKKMTVISGVNGVGKSNILSLIASGSGTNRKSPMGSNYQPEFAEFFNIDKDESYQDYKLYLKYIRDDGEFAIARRLSFKDDSDTNRGIRIIPRTTNVYEQDITNTEIAKRNKKIFDVGGSARVKIPTIYSSLSRLYPLGEKTDYVKINKVRKTNLLIQKKVNEKFREWYNSIIPGAIAEKAEVSVIDKSACARASLHMDIINTPTLSQSIGQDNIGNIISSLTELYILSLEESYNGGILCIDEIEVSLHPDTQVRMLMLLKKLSEELKIQIVLSTHSLTVLKECLKLEEHSGDDYKVIYLKNPSAPMVSDKKSYALLKADMFGKLSFNQPRVRIYFEDEIGKILFYQLLNSYRSIVKIVDDCKSEEKLRNSEKSNKQTLDEKIISLKSVLNFNEKLKPIVTHLGCENLIKIAEADMYFKRVIIMLDGDARIKECSKKPLAKDYMDKYYNAKEHGECERKHEKNIIFAPNFFAPESYLYRIIMKVCKNPHIYNSFWRGLDLCEDTALYTSDKIKNLFSSISDDFSNDDLKKIFGDDISSSEVWQFILNSHLLEYFYSDYETVLELLDFLSKLQTAYNIALPLTISNRYV